MTLQDLRQYKSIQAEKNRIAQRLNKLRLELAEAESEELKQKIKELYTTLENIHKQQIAKELEITKMLESIQDYQVRISVELHYIDGYSWNKVADVIGGGNTDDGCRKYVSRYFKKLSDMTQTN